MSIFYLPFLLTRRSLVCAPARYRANRRCHAEPQPDGRDHRGDVAERQYADVTVHDPGKDHQHPGADEEQRSGGHQLQEITHRPPPTCHRTDSETLLVRALSWRRRRTARTIALEDD